MTLGTRTPSADIDGIPRDEPFAPIMPNHGRIPYTTGNVLMPNITPGGRLENTTRGDFVVLSGSVAGRGVKGHQAVILLRKVKYNVIGSSCDERCYCAPRLELFEEPETEGVKPAGRARRA
jgi:hypothetical protein